jgi:hypothetical protein
MSLVYDENSDEIQCALRVNIHETEVCSLTPDGGSHQVSCGYACTRVYVHA